MLRKNPCSKIYDFETFDDYIYNKFLLILELFDIIPLDTHDAIGDGSKTCKFCTTPHIRTQIECVLRRAIKLEPLYLLNQDSYQNRAVRYREERYAIY